jgi:hypothetical protein
MLPPLPEYDPALDRLHIRWALRAAARFPSWCPYYGRVIKYALARLREHGCTYKEAP